MWSVTEQNHLHYPAVMFHRSGLVHWWPPAHFSASTSLLLLLHVSIFCKWERLLAIQRFFKTFFPLISSLFHPPSIRLSSSTPIFLCSVRALLHHLSLVYLHSYFLLSFCLCLEMLPSVCTCWPDCSCIICTSSSQFCWSQITAALCNFLFPQTCLVSGAHWGFWAVF